MAQASTKPATRPETVAPAAAQPRREAPILDAAGLEGDGAESPARALQARLEAEMALEPKMSARSVTVLVVTVCLATWFAGFLLYASL